VYSCEPGMVDLYLENWPASGEKLKFMNFQI